MNDEITIKDLVILMSKLMNTEIKINSKIDRIRPEKSEVERLYCNNKRILENTLWKPKYNLNSGLLETIEWMKKNINNYKSDIYNV